MKNRDLIKALLECDLEDDVHVQGSTFFEPHELHNFDVDDTLDNGVIWIVPSK